MPRLPILDEEDWGVPQQHSALPGFAGFAEKFIPAAEVREIYRRIRSTPQGLSLETLLAEMQVRLQVQPGDFERVPAKGPLVAVANHPFGVLDGAALGVLLSRVRPDVKVMTNSLLKGLPELREHCIFLDPSYTSSQEGNMRAMHRSIAWLRSGGALAVFPAGEVSQLNVRQGEVTDPGWSNFAANLIRSTGASALPV